MTSQNFRPITVAQIRMMHFLYIRLGWDEDFKRDQLLKLTNGRTGSTKELSRQHAKYFIEWANEKMNIFSPLSKLRKKVLAICYTAGYIYGDTDEDRAMNYAKIDRFLKERGSVKKGLFEQSEQEIKKTIRQFKAMFNHNNEHSASFATKALLNELNLTTQY